MLDFFEKHEDISFLIVFVGFTLLTLSFKEQIVSYLGLNNYIFLLYGIFIVALIYGGIRFYLISKK